MTRLTVFTCALLALTTIARADDRVLLDFEDPAQLKQVGHLDSVAELIDRDGGKALKVTFGCDKPYPNVTFAPPPPDGPWNLAAFTGVAIDITNLDDESLKIGARVDNPGATGQKNAVTGGTTVEPGQTQTLLVEFNRVFATELRAKLRGMHYSPWGKREPHGGAIDPAKVVSVNIFVNKPVRSHTIAVDNIRAVGSFDPATLSVPEPFFPFVDEYGQYIHADWPGKVKTDADLAAARDAEAAAIDQSPRPKSWDRFGGWADGPTLEATGHFRTAQHNGKWHLVDPEGRLFFSLGIDVVQMGGATPVTDDRADWFRNPPWKTDSPLAVHLGEGKVGRGEYQGVVPEYSFYAANLQRKFGTDWKQAWYGLMPRRIMNWGFNTIACWSDAKLFKNTQTPYAHWVFINAAKLPWQAGSRNRISDPFHPMLEQELRRRARLFVEPFKDDPMCIGFFVDNELSWGDEDHLARGVVTAGKPDEAAKQAFRDWLAEKYGSIGTFNAAWGLSLADFDAFLANTAAPKTDAGKADLLAFNELIVRRYFQTVRDVLKDIAPGKLYLGCRFAESNPQVVRAAGDYCDVVSFNLYRHTVAAWRPPAAIDKPVVIGEFHFGASDRGVFGRGLVHADNSADRAVLFERYVRSALKNPQIVGAHWFALVDEPTSGRTLEGENHGFGFLAVTDTPHAEMLETARRLAADLYTIRSAE